MFYLHSIRSKEPPIPITSKEPLILDFPTLNPIYKLAATADPSYGEIGNNSQNKNCRVSLEFIRK